MISIIAAMDEKRGIGKNGSIPWYIPEDFKHFKEITMGHPVIIGRRTFESIGKILPGRANIIVSRNLDDKTTAGEVSWASSLTDAINLAKEKEGSDEVFIIGGGEIYKQALENNLVEKMYLTIVDGEYDADTFFPEFSGFMEENSEEHENSKNKFSFKVLTKSSS